MSVTSVPIRARVLPSFLPVNGKSVELRATEDFIQWRMVGQDTWTDLVALTDITGGIGPATEYRNNGSFIQYRPVGTDPDAEWFDLIAVSAITGPAPGLAVGAITIIDPLGSASGEFNDDITDPAIKILTLELPGATVPDGSLSVAKTDGSFGLAEFDTVALAAAWTPSVAPASILPRGYAAAGDGGGALYKRVMAEPSHAGKFSITLSDGVTVVWYEIAEATFRPRMFGVVADLVGTTGTDDRAALQAMFDAVPAGATIDFGSLKARFASDLTISKSINITGSGWVLYGDGAMLTVAGARTDMTYISAVAASGARSVTVNSAAGIAAGNILILQNTNSGSFYTNAIDSRDYTDGEFIEVESVSGSTVTFKTLLKTSYGSGATYKVFKVDLVEFNAEGGTIEGTASFVLNLRHCTGLDLKINVIGGLTRAVYINQCYRGFIPPGGRYIHKPAVSTGNNYGISFSNSQDILVEDVFAFGLRHGISIGGAPGDGAVPCRNIVVKDARIGNDTPSLHAADIHGWAVKCYYEDCDVDGAVGLGGLDCGAPGCRVVNKRTDAAGKAILLTELVGGTVDLRNMKVRHAPGALATNVFGIAAGSQFGGGGGGQMQNYHINLNGLEVDCIASVTQIVSHLHNLPGAIKWSIEANDFNLSGDVSGLTNVLALIVSNTLSHPSAPVRADRVTQQGLSWLGTSEILVPSLSGTWTGCKFDITAHGGSGVNGNYLRNSDGTLDCWQDFTATAAVDVAFLGGFRSGAQTWTFPATFLANVPVEGTPVNGSATGITGSGAGTSSATFFFTTTATQTAASRSARVRARGRYLP